MKLKNPLVLIPAAGFGTRVGKPEAKELIQNIQGIPLIQRGLDQARIRGWPVHVITRKEKPSLIQFLENYQRQHHMDLSIQLIEPSREWPDTVLQSVAYWQDHNLLCLPDTEYEPLDIWDQMKISLQEFSLVAATFSPPSLSTWGAMRLISENEIEICEKPQVEFLQAKAWGILGFSKEAGQILFEAQLASTFDHQIRKLSLRAQFLPLKSFQDVTR